MMALPMLNVAKRAWVLGPWRDLSLFILPMLWIIPSVFFLFKHADPYAFGATLLVLGSVGHHLPGFIRAYTDPQLFRRYRRRFLLAPLFLFALCAVFAWHGLHSLTLVLALWGAWHGAMQVYGFLRIYDAKAGSISPWTARLDWGMCLFWFAGGMLHSSNRMMALFAYFYETGGVLIPPPGFFAFRTAWDLGTAAITLAFIANAILQVRRGHAISPIKVLAMVSSFAFWWYCMIGVDSLLLGILLFEIFHDVQYNAMVWVYNGKRVQSGLTASRLEKFLFQDKAGRFSIYLLLVLAYGSLGLVFNYVGTPTGPETIPKPEAFSAWGGLFIVSGFLHFYFDGFIWKIRDSEIRQGFGLEAVKTVRETKPVSDLWARWMAPSLKWSLLFVFPVAALGLSEYRGQAVTPLERYRNITQILPENWYAHFALASLELENKGIDSAIFHFEKALANKPELDFVHATLASLYRERGDMSKALPHYEKAIVADPDNPALQFQLAMAWMQSKRPDKAIPYLRGTLALEPTHKEALNYLGIALQMQGEISEAATYYRLALQIDADYSGAKANLDQAEKILASGR